MQDCRGEEQNDRIEMKGEGKAEHCKEHRGGQRGGEKGKIVIMKTSA